MLSKEDTMVRLNKERELEDHLVFVLGEYVLTSLQTISDITEDQRWKIRTNLEIVLADSKLHSHLFSHLLQMVIEDEKNQF